MRNKRQVSGGRRIIVGHSRGVQSSVNPVQHNGQPSPVVVSPSRPTRPQRTQAAIRCLFQAQAAAAWTGSGGVRVQLTVSFAHSPSRGVIAGSGSRLIMADSIPVSSRPGRRRRSIELRCVDRRWVERRRSAMRRAAMRRAATIGAKRGAAMRRSVKRRSVNCRAAKRRAAKRRAAMRRRTSSFWRDAAGGVLVERLAPRVVDMFGHAIQFWLTTHKLTSPPPTSLPAPSHPPRSHTSTLTLIICQTN